MGETMSGSPVITIRLQPCVVALIKEHPDYKKTVNGVGGGVGDWLKQLIYRELNIPTPKPRRRGAGKKNR